MLFHGYTVLLHADLCTAVLCHAVLCHAVLCHAMPLGYAKVYDLRSPALRLHAVLTWRMNTVKVSVTT